ncbi:hypothetical protein BT67DRAFT_444293 [Trichocladium antarcticum]|uniref:Uncharacterized protein n=1 Tax=Trichocladium antarcticum TaxID=1450529 RepID=A0AAN6UF75_9PEZI|nr:hypothetical protein BT67DRAFT_444293 [Trichocladium antarcticum]
MCQAANQAASSVAVQLGDPAPPTLRICKYPYRLHFCRQIPPVLQVLTSTCNLTTGSQQTDQHSAAVAIMPGLTIATNARPTSASARGTTANPRRGTSTASPTTRTSSPPRPPVSPITPTLGPTQLPGGPTTTTTSKPNTNNHDAIPDFALGRPTFTHATQAEQVGITPPPPQPIDFDENPDVLALKSAISILQLQRARAAADIQSLSRAKQAALADPAAFAADLAAGRVHTEGDPLFSSAAGTADSDSDSDSGSNSDSEQAQPPPSTTGDTPMTDATDPQPSSSPPPSPSPSPSPAAAANPQNPSRNDKQRPPRPAWRSLPKPQTIVRCPPINWAQYGVVGESLDKLHAAQRAAPSPGAPAVLPGARGGGGPGAGAYEFRAGGRGGGGGGGGHSGSGFGGVGGAGERLAGVAAPYVPGRDKIEKKGKAGRR